MLVLVDSRLAVTGEFRGWWSEGLEQGKAVWDLPVGVVDVTGLVVEMEGILWWVAHAGLCVRSAMCLKVDNYIYCWR